MKNRKKDWFLFSFYSLAAAYTHYYALLAVTFLYVMLIVYEIWKKGEHWERIMMICFAAVVFYIPWLLNLLRAFGRTAENWWLEQIPEFRYCIQYLFSSKISFWYVGIWGMGIFVLFYNTYVKKRENYEFTFFIFSGLVSIIGTISAGEIISLLWRPMFQMKYVYVVAGVAWFIFGLVIDRLKKNNIWTVGILMITFVIGVPNYYNWIKNDIECKLGTQKILENTKSMEVTDVLLTNSEHLNWTMLEYYYPDNECVFTEKDLAEEDLGNGDWLFWNEELEELSGYKIAEGYLGPYNYIYVYKIE